MSSIEMDATTAPARRGAGNTLRSTLLTIAVTAAALPLGAGGAHAKGGSDLAVSTTASVTGSVVAGIITIANGGAAAATVTAISSALEVRFPSGTTPPPLPAGSTSGWYRVASVALPAPLSVPVLGSRSVAFAIDTCGGGAAGFAGAKDMRSVASVTAGKVLTARSLNFALPAKCAVCGNRIREGGEQCDAGSGGGACCTATCQFRPTGTACSDGNGCTQTDRCEAGSCVGGNPLSCAPLDQCHDSGTCNPATGTCSNPAKANGTPCSDQNACTQTDTCQSGACRGANPVTCSATSSCMQAACDPGTGSCSSQPRADGTECIDGDACTVGDNCVAGECTSGAGRSCDDHLSCTDDVCEAATGCAHVATPTCEGCDAAECTLCGETCDAANAQCTANCWSGFMACLDGCTSTYCAPFCQVDLGGCLTACPATTTCRSGCEAGNGCAAGCVEP